MKNNGNKIKKQVSKYALLGGAIGGIVSSLVSSPQSQYYWWNKEPSNRWNIVLWDSIALAVIFYFIGMIKQKNLYKYIAGGLLFGGIALSKALKVNPYLLDKALKSSKIGNSLVSMLEKGGKNVFLQGIDKIIR